MRAFDALPRREMFFPKTRRGHGSMRTGTLCVDPTCTLNQPKSKNAHVDTEANLKDWCEDHQLSLKYTSAFTAMLRATGAR